jgi:hypothetical protein
VSFARARKEALNIVQWAARVANSFVPVNAPERLLLKFSLHDAALTTQPFEHDITFEIRLPTLEMQFRENGIRVPHVFDPEERSPAEVEAWLLVELLHRGLDRSSFTNSLPYTIPDLLMGDAEDYSPQSCAQGLADLAAWFRGAAIALQAAAPAITGSNVDIACSPEALTLTCLSNRHSSTYLGFSPGNDEIQEPFFFVQTRNRGERSILLAQQLAGESDPVMTASEFLKRGGDENCTAVAR